MISIIYPVYNVEHYLEKSLQSLLNQDFADFEIIAVNDGSTDGSLAILENFARHDSRIKVYAQENQGVAQTRFNALKKATGEFVCFVDSDDTLPQNALSSLYNSLINNESDVSEGNFCKIFSSGEVTNYSFPEQEVVTVEENIDLLLSRRVIYSLCAKLFKKSLFDDVQIKKFAFLEDFCFAIQAFSKARKVSLVNSCVYNYIQRDSSAVHSHFSDKAVADYYFSKLWIADYIRLNFKNYNNLTLLNEFILQGFAYTLCLGGKRFLKNEDILNCKRIFTNCKKCLPIGQRIVVQTVDIPIVNNFLIKIYQIRIKNSKR